MNINAVESIITGKINNKILNQDIGIVISVFNNIVIAEGLSCGLYGEKVTFNNNIEGVIYFLEENLVKILIISDSDFIKEGDVVYSTGRLFYVPIPKEFKCLFNNTWELNDLLMAKYDEYDEKPIDIIAPGIIERDFVKESLHTGVLLVDSLIPIGKGQRELIIGNSNSGKSALALDMIVSQKSNKKIVYCIYVAIGQKASTVKRIQEILQKENAMEYTMIITANASHSATAQYMIPYVAMTIAEYLKNKMYDVLVIFDDLTQHAIAYREINLLLKNIPGREAYSGDIFYIHARLLERCGNFKNKGSITGIPIVSTHDVTSYIPTNIISITDGQIFLDNELFNKGQKPAINIGISVSRLGGAVQGKFMKKVCSSLKIDLACSEELEKFLQFSSDVDEVTQKIIDKGRNIKKFFKQKTCQPYKLWEEIVILFILTNELIKDINLNIFTDIFTKLENQYSHIIDNITKDQLVDETLKQLKDIIYGIINTKK